MTHSNFQVVGAAVSGWLFGALWYGVFSKPWMKAANLSMDKISREASPTPYLISLIGCIATSAMLRYVFERAEVTSHYDSFETGLGVGLFIAVPWTVNNILYGLRNPRLIVYDGGYAALGTAIIGLALSFF